MNIKIDVELDDEMSRFVRTKTGDGKHYATVQDYVTALIEEDVERRTREFEEVKAELQGAFAAPENSYEKLTAQDVIERNRSRPARAA